MVAFVILYLYAGMTVLAVVSQHGAALNRKEKLLTIAVWPVVLPAFLFNRVKHEVTQSGV